jgi:hypothetical protein
MNSLLVLLLILFIVGGIFWLLRFHTPKHRQSVKNPAAAHANTNQQYSGGLEKLRENEFFWGVSIGQAGCEAASKLIGQQFTFDKAPELPVEGCSAAFCTCRFKGLKDRRTQHRRGNDERRDGVRFDKGGSDRRSRKDRRSGNWDDHSY